MLKNRKSPNAGYCMEVSTMDEKFSDKVFATAHNIVGGFTVVVPKAQQASRLEQSVLTESDV